MPCYLRISLLVSFLSAGGYVHSENLSFQSAAVGYVNFNADHEILFIEENGQMSRMRNGRLESSMSYAIQHEDCRPSKVDAMSGLGLALAWPYLVASNRVCLIDEATRSIRLLQETDVPPNAFGTMYLTEDENFSYFVVVGRPWETKGYLKLWSIDKKSSSAQLSDWIEGLPGYSGGMWRDGRSLYVALSYEDEPSVISNKLYQIDLTTLAGLAASSRKTDFNSIAQKSRGPFEGFSFTIAAQSGSWLLLFNEGFESFFLDFDSGEKRIVPVESGCVPYQAGEGQWYQLCDQRELKELAVDL